MTQIVFYGGQKIDFVYLKVLIKKRAKLCWVVNIEDLLKLIEEGLNIDLLLMELDEKKGYELEEVHLLANKYPDIPKTAIVDYLPEKRKREEIKMVFNDIIVRPIKKELFNEKMKGYLT